MRRYSSKPSMNLASTFMIARFLGFLRSSTRQSSLVSNIVSLAPVMSIGSGDSDLFNMVIDFGLTSGPIFAICFSGTEDFNRNYILDV